MRPAGLHEGDVLNASEVVKLLAEIGLPALVIAYVLLMPEKAQMVSGWLRSLIARVYRRADRAAVARRVQGQVNASTARLQKDAPKGLIEGRLKITWGDAEETKAVLRDGEVIVFMRRSKHHEENVAHALMVYLPKAVLPRARRYLDKATMQAVDLTIAKSVLGGSPSAEGVLDVFYQQHMDPACEADVALQQRVVAMDEIDLHGWLLRVLLPEFRRLGNQLYPAHPDVRCAADAESFARWLHSLAARKKGDESVPLSYSGAFLRVALVWVAQSEKLAREGIEPYRKYAKRQVYSGRFDAVYLMAWDRNIWAVRDIVDNLASDGRVESAGYHEFPLRSDFAKRKLSRQQSIVACLVPHQPTGSEEAADEEVVEVEASSATRTAK